MFTIDGQIGGGFQRYSASLPKPGSNSMRLPRSFTLREMLVAVAVIGMLLAIAAPLLEAGRESARSAQCCDNLRQFYGSLALYSDNDPMGRFTSGAFDGKRDGCIDTVGWVADMVTTGSGQPGKLLCPSNRARVSEAVNDYLGPIAYDPNEATPDVSRFNAGACPAVAAATGFGKRQAVIDHFLRKGYNTNYACSWFLVRQSPWLSVSGDYPYPRVITYPVSKFVQGVPDTTGPLVRTATERSYHTSAIIPLQFDANVLDPKEVSLAANLGDFGTVGDPVTASFSGGPAELIGGATWQPWGTVVAITVHDDADPATSIFHREQPRPPDPSSYPWADLQDWRDMGPVHNGSCNVLFADGGVRTFKDQNKDGYLNPGFVIASGLTPVQLTKIRYTDSLIELPPSQVFSGVFVFGLPPSSPNLPR
jgi:prepilin-type processing-associated H-X9-DG protein/prepilin-type N-terminal cleavage/methylation domain-containing protein